MPTPEVPETPTGLRDTLDRVHVDHNARRFEFYRAPLMCQIANRRRNALSPIYLRARYDVRALKAAHRPHQELDLGVGPTSPFCKGRAGTISRALTQLSALDAFLHLYAPKDDGDPKGRRRPKPHPAAKALKKAEAWQARIDSAKVESKASIAREEGVSRARVTQVLGLLKLAPEIRERILSKPSTNGHRPLSERSLRPHIGLPPSRQLVQFKKLQRVQ